MSPSGHDLFVEESAFHRRFDIPRANGEITEAFAFLTLGCITSDDWGEFVDDVFRLH